MTIKILLTALMTILPNVLKTLKGSAIQSMFSKLLTFTIELLLKNWKIVLSALTLISVSFLIGWQMKSPRIVYKTEVVNVPTVIETIEYKTIVKPNNCEIPDKAKKSDIGNAAEVINYYRREWVFKYKACLESLS